MSRMVTNERMRYACLPWYSLDDPPCALHQPNMRTVANELGIGYAARSTLIIVDQNDMSIFSVLESEYYMELRCFITRHGLEHFLGIRITVD